MARRANLEHLTKPLYESPGDDSASEIEEGEMDVCTLVVADAEAAESVQPGKAALDDPAVSAQALLGFDTTAGYARDDATLSEIVPAESEVVSLVRMQIDRPAARASAASRDGGGTGQQRNEVLAVVVVGCREADRQRQPSRINEQVMLAARFGAVAGIGADAFATEGGMGRWKHPNYSGASRFAQPFAGAGGSADAGVPRPLPPAIPAAAASTSCRYRTPFPAAGLPTGYRSSVQTECRPGQHGRAPVAGRPTPKPRAPATRAQSATITHLIPGPGPCSPPTATSNSFASGNHQDHQFGRTVLIDGLRAGLRKFRQFEK